MVIFVTPGIEKVSPNMLTMKSPQSTYLAEFLISDYVSK